MYLAFASGAPRRSLISIKDELSKLNQDQLVDLFLEDAHLIEQDGNIPPPHLHLSACS